MSLYGDIKACEAAGGMRPDLAAACIYFAATNIHYGVPSAPLVCPAGPEPEPAPAVAAIVKRTINVFGITGQDAADVERYVGERYELAMADWALRVEACVGSVGAGAAKGDDSAADARAGFPGFVAIILGLGLIAASRTK